MSHYDAVGAMHKHFGLPSTNDIDVPHLIDADVINFRLKFLREELAELQKAYKEEDLVEIADALVDIVVVAMGTAHLHNLPFDRIFEEVMETNMKKVRVIDQSQSKRGSGLDLAKPAGWKPPMIGRILAKFGWVKHAKEEKWETDKLL
jgi:hypothetical protein